LKRPLAGGAEGGLAAGARAEAAVFALRGEGLAAVFAFGGLGRDAATELIPLELEGVVAFGRVDGLVGLVANCTLLRRRTLACLLRISAV